jgi:fatty-acyl-CoA synthase
VSARRSKVIPNGFLLSLVSGVPLSAEPGLGALTIPGYLREVRARFGPREALVLRTERGAVRWTYDTLWERSLEVACALIASGVGKDSRIGVLMTNRPEFLAVMFGVALVGGTTVPLSTFATAPELEYLLKASCVSTLLFESEILKRSFTETLLELEPLFLDAEPGNLMSSKFPFLRRAVQLGGLTDARSAAAIENWTEFLERGAPVPAALVEARRNPALTACDRDSMVALAARHEFW